MTDTTKKAMTLEQAKEIIDRMCESESVPPSPNPMCNAVCKLVDADDCYALRDWFKEHLSAQREEVGEISSDASGGVKWTEFGAGLPIGTKIYAGSTHEVRRNSIELTSGQIAQLANFSGRDDESFEDQARLTISYESKGHSGPGIYSHYSEYPEDGYLFLDGKWPETQRDSDPVAWRYRLKTQANGDKSPPWAFTTEKLNALQRGIEVEPLYNAPPIPEQRDGDAPLEHLTRYDHCEDVATGADSGIIPCPDGRFLKADDVGDLIVRMLARINSAEGLLRLAEPEIASDSEHLEELQIRIHRHFSGLFQAPPHPRAVTDELEKIAITAAEKWANDNGFVGYMCPTGYVRAALEAALSEKSHG